MPKYHRLTLDERYRIEAELRAGRSNREIAALTDRNQSTIWREVTRNSRYGKLTYSASAAESKALDRRRFCCRKPVLNEQLRKLVEEKLSLWSPAQIAGRWNIEGFAKISHETIYRFARKHNPCRIKLRMYNRRGAGRMRQRRRQKPEWMRFISSRPKSVLNRRMFGHWERDTMFAAKRERVLVLVERKSRYAKLARLRARDSACVTATTKKLIENSPVPVHTMTNDNGSEFSDGFQYKFPVYYCDPGKPQQRGTVENTIGLLRKYIGRTTHLNQLSDRQLNQIEGAINLRPRKCLGFKTPYEVFHKQRIALAN